LIIYTSKGARRGIHRYPFGWWAVGIGAACAFLWSSCGTVEQFRKSCLFPPYCADQPGTECRSVDKDPLLAGEYKCVPPAPPPPTTTTMPAPPTCTPPPPPAIPEDWVCRMVGECSWECGPLPSPKPTPSPVPTPTPEPVPTPTPKPPKPPAEWCHVDGRPRSNPPAPTDCSTPMERVLQEIRSGNWLPSCSPDGTGPRREPGVFDCQGGRLRGMYGCGPAGEVAGCTPVACVDLALSRVDCGNWGRVLKPNDDHRICVKCAPPSAPPTPPPSSPPPSPPPPGSCPPVLEYGSSSLGFVDCGKCREQGFVGYRMNHTGTPLRASTPDNPCPLSSQGEPRLRCEMPKECQDPRGATIYMSLDGGWQNGLCEPKSENPFNCGHKPTPADLGVTTFWACPPGAPPDHPQCGARKRFDVRPEGPREIK
jgi:hypothetical protein